MALSQTQPYEERVREIAWRMKEIIETEWPKDPELVGKEVEEFRQLKAEIESMGLFVVCDVEVSIDENDIKLNANIEIYASRDTTTH